MLDLGILLSGVTVFGLTYFYLKGRPPKSLPPGPKGKPFIGHLDLIYYAAEKKFHITTAEWGKQYNGLYTLQYAHIPSIMVTDLEIAREALVDNADVWSDRPLQDDYMKLVTSYSGGGVILQNGPKWKSLRRLTMQSLRDLGVGKKSIEGKILDELAEIIHEIDSYGNKPITFYNLFHQGITNVICNVLLGDRFEYTSQEYQKMLQGFRNMFEYAGFANVFMFLPWYTFWCMPILQPKVKDLFVFGKYMGTFIEDKIKQHRETFDADNLRDFIDIYIDTEQKDPNLIYNEKNFAEVVMDLFLAGSETTSTTLVWAILFMLKHPEVQSKCRREIHDKIGTNRPPSYQDKANMPYVEATMSEMQRMSSIAAVIPLHNSAQTTKLRGFTIPKNTQLNINVYAIHMDPKLFKDPTEFRPERFLDNNGAYKKPEGFIPFGIGKRACLGEMLARMEYFLFFTGLLQKLEFRCEDPSTLPSIDDTKLGATLIPKPFKAVVHKV